MHTKLLCLGLALFGAGPALGQASFTGLTGPVGTTDIEPVSISSNGVTVVGANSNGAFKWDAVNGMIQLGAPAGLTSAVSNDVSDDGNTIVGNALDPNNFDEFVPFRWTPGTGSVRLNAVDFGAGNTISGDGTVIGGQAYFGTGDEAFRWDSGTGIVGVGQPSASNSSIFDQMTVDGTVFVGNAVDNSSGDTFAIRWDSTNGFETLNGVGSFEPLAAFGVSNDGDVVVGLGITSGSSLFEAFIWDPVNDATGLGFVGGMAGSEESIAVDVSADGSTVVGGSTVGASTDFEAAIWDATNGMRNLETELNALGAGVPTGWTLDFAIGISSDGNTITGTGTNPSGNPQGWVANLPEPSTQLGLGFGTLLLMHLAPTAKRERRSRAA